MEKKIVVFSGSDIDQFGMPTPFHFYGVFASRYTENGIHVVVTKIAFSQGLLPDTERTKIVGATTELEALNSVIEELKNNPVNKGLTMQTSDIPQIKL